MDLDTIRELLVQWGVTNEVLLCIGFASLITLFFSVRVVIKWYLGIQHVHDELRRLNQQVADLHLRMSQNRWRDEASSIAPATPISEKPSRHTETFRLSH